MQTVVAVNIPNDGSGAITAARLLDFRWIRVRFHAKGTRPQWQVQKGAGSRVWESAPGEALAQRCAEVLAT